MLENPHISVIMPSFLGEYPGAAKNREFKFVRAVRSFLLQSYQNKSLVIVADGCKETELLYKENFKEYSNIDLVKIEKQPLFSGNVRQAGIDYATKYFDADIIAPADADDMFKQDHLEVIAKNMKDNDFIYGDEYWFIKAPEGSGRKKVMALHKVELKKDVAGTSSVVWRNKPEFSWAGLDGWQHDNLFIQTKLIPNSKKYSKVEGLGYVICHIKGIFDS